MCAPILTVAAVGLQVAAGAYNAYNENENAKAQQQYYNHLAAQNEAQGRFEINRGNVQSKAIQDVAKEQGKQFQSDAARQNSSQRAQLAAQGITGVTAEDISNDSFNRQKLDELSLRYNADVKSYEVLTDAQYKKYALDSQASQYRFAGEQARAAGKRNVFQTLLGTAVSTVSPFVKYK
ncbi:MAG: hypothetical protein HC880_00520 [Bacteroidia bacterium]|nr:hypothetical protein [Bacteroidia bacterium]